MLMFPFPYIAHIVYFVAIRAAAGLLRVQFPPRRDHVFQFITALPRLQFV